MQSEYGLYVYLKDGVELCRTIGLIVNGKVPEGIIYETNNIPALEQENLALFLKIVTKEFPKFKPKKGNSKEIREGFSKFHLFNLALFGLSKLSKEISDKYSIPPFSSSGKMTKGFFDEENYKVNDVYSKEPLQEVSDSGFNEVNTKYGNMIVRKEGTGVNFAVAELAQFNRKIMDNVLRELKKSGESTAPGHNFLREKVFPGLRMDALLERHKQVGDILEDIQYSYTDLGSAFERIQGLFLAYSEVLVDSKSAMQAILNRVSEIECGRNKRDGPANQEELCNLREVISHIEFLPILLRMWPSALAAVESEADHEQRFDIKQEAGKARNCMEVLLECVSKVAKDSEYITAMDNFSIRINSIPTNDLHQYGILHKVIENVDYKSGSNWHEAVESKHDLLLFDEYIVVLKLESTIGERQYQYVEEFKLNQCPNTSVSSEHGGNKMRWVWFGRQSTGPAFTVHVPSSHAFDLEALFKQFIEASKSKISSADHSNHSLKKYKAKRSHYDFYDYDSDQSLRCGYCLQLFCGLLVSGIWCVDCSKIYHHGCFTKEKEEIETLSRDLPEDPENLDLELSDFDLTFHTKEEITETFQSSAPGTFALVSCEKSYEQELVRKDMNNDLRYYQIKSVVMKGHNMFFIEEGTSDQSILGLVKKHRRSHNFLFPINAANDDDSPKIRFYGTMNAREATNLLKQKPIGTWILRYNDKGEPRLSVQTQRSVAHVVFQRSSRGFHWSTLDSDPLSFDTLVTKVKEHLALRDTQMVPHLDTTSPDDDERTNIKPTCEVPEKADVEEKQGSNQEPFSLNYFHGTMTALEAEEKLFRMPPWTFVLRKSLDNAYWISYKGRAKISHIEIGFTSGKFRASNMSSTSITDLLEKLVNQAAFSRPLQPNFPMLGVFSDNETRDALRERSVGTWMLRYDTDGHNEVLSVKRGKGVEDLKIIRSECGGVTLRKKYGNPQRLEDLLRHMKTNGQLKEQIIPDFSNVAVTKDKREKSTSPGSKESKFVALLIEAERILQRESVSREFLVHVLKRFEGETLQEAWSEFDSLSREVALMILGLLCPELATKLSDIAEVPLEKFSSPSAVSHYLQALIQSGVAADIERGVIYVMGNSSVGKTSLVNTFKRYTENPKEGPWSKMTQKDDTLYETQMLEIYSGVNVTNVEEGESIEIDLKQNNSGNQTISFKKSSGQGKDKNERRQLKITLFDFGGHTALCALND